MAEKHKGAWLGVQPANCHSPPWGEPRGREVRLSRQHMDSIVCKFQSSVIGEALQIKSKA